MYEVGASRAHPACLIFVLDRSYSMNDPIAGSDTPRAIVLAEVVNNAIYELILRSVKDPREGPRHYYDIGIIGYSDEAHADLAPRFDGRALVPSDELARNPVRVESVRMGDRVVKRPVWAEPIADGWTSTCKALDLAGSLAFQWVNDPAHQHSFPPVVVHVTDGESTDGDPLEWAARLRSLRTTDGNLLLFNVSVGGGSPNSLLFPHSPAQLPDPFAQRLFAMSSELPQFMLTTAARQGIQTAPGARGLAYNADLSALVTALQVGTAAAPPGGVR